MSNFCHVLRFVRQIFFELQFGVETAYSVFFFVLLLIGIVGT